MNDLVKFEERTKMTAADIRSNVNLVQEVMQAVMKKDVHYGTIPGTPKPTLYKPGAEVLAATFRIAVSYRIEDLSGSDVVRYRVTATGTHQTTGIVMGEGMGECSSMEEKYKWRKAVSPKEFDATTEDRRRVKYGREYSINQVRTEPADLANTVLKMACKRAQVAMTLNVTAASDIFTQDIEDLPPELQPNDEPVRAPVQQPKSKSAPAAAQPSTPPSSTEGGGSEAADPAESPLASEGAKATLTRQLERAGRTATDLTAAGFPAIDEMRFGDLNRALAWLKAR